jgi:hypothetical protein
MSLRTQQDLINHICVYKLKDFEKSAVVDPGAPKAQVQTSKIKQLVPKLDANGNVIYKTVIIQVKKGCGCKGTAQTVENKEQKVPDMVEIEVDSVQTPKLNLTPDPGRYVICKLYGTVKSSLCENCKTYKASK